MHQIRYEESRSQREEDGRRPDESIVIEVFAERHHVAYRER